MKKAIAVAVAVAAFGAWASILSPVVKPIARDAVKSATRAETKAVSQAAVHAGASRVVAAPALAAVEARRASALRADGAVGKLATPKNIVAAGIGTAAVVGTHEVADGVQSALESTGRAIEENPEVGSSIWDSLIAPVKWLALAVFAAVAAFLTWMFWPFVLLVVRGARLFRAKMSRRLAERTAPGQPETIEMPCAMPGRVNGYVLVAVAVICLLAVLNVWRISTRDGRANSAEAERLSAEFSEEVRRCNADFMAEANSVAAAEFGAVRSKIPSIAKKYGTFSHCCSLVKSLAVDKLSGGHETQDKINAGLEQEYYDGIYSARDALADCVRRHGERLAGFVKNYKAKLSEISPDDALVNNDEFAEALAKASNEIKDAKDNLAVGQIDAAAAVALEAVCVRQTAAAVAKVLGRAAAREAGAAAIGAGAAAADGPIPVGDCIGAAVVIGCTALSGYDVYKAKKVLPQELEESLRTTVDQCEKRSLRDVAEICERLQQALLAKGDGQ